MTVYRNRNVETLTEVVQNNCCGTCIGATVTGAHRTGFVQKKSYSELRDLLRQVVLIEHLTVITAKSVGIKPASHNETGLFTSAPFFLELLKKTLLELTGNGDEWPGDVIELVNQFFIYRGNSIYSDVYTFMHVPVGNILGNVVEFSDTLSLQLLTGSFFSHLIQ